MIETLASRLDELKSQHMEHIINGNATSFEDYRHNCGVIRGIAMAERELKEIQSQIEE
mgnify:CR=1 FL=1